MILLLTALRAEIAAKYGAPVYLKNKFMNYENQILKKKKKTTQKKNQSPI